MTAVGPQRRISMSDPMSAVGGLSGLNVLTVSFVARDPQQTSHPIPFYERARTDPLPVSFSSRHHVSGSRLPHRNLNSAAHALWCEHEINLASQLVRNEIAYEIGTVAGLGLGFHRWAIELLPD
jgi:hypothetical protein